MKLFNKIIVSILPAFFSILGALLIGVILLLISGYNPLVSYSVLFYGAFGTFNRFLETLVRATPIMIIALGLSVAFKNKIWNIGGIGQFTAGAILATVTAVNLSFLPTFLLFPITFVSSFIGGAIIGIIIGYLRAKFNANEVITSLMFNYIMLYLLSYLLRGPLMDPGGFGFAQSESIPMSLRLPRFFPGNRFNFGFIVAVIIATILYFFWKSILGFKIRMAGESKHVATQSGINVKRNIIITTLISAGIVGISGWVEVFGLHYRLLEQMGGNIGDYAVVVTLLANLNPFGIIVSSIFVAALMVGGETMQRLAGVPFTIVNIIFALTIMFVISRVIFRKWGNKIAAKNIFSRIFN